VIVWFMLPSDPLSEQLRKRGGGHHGGI
jgi:hypothetical protein